MGNVNDESDPQEEPDEEPEEDRTTLEYRIHRIRKAETVLRVSAFAESFGVESISLFYLTDPIGNPSPLYMN